jgi:hypothetical protein
MLFPGLLMLTPIEQDAHSTETPAIAAWLEHPAPVRARSVPLRLPDAINRGFRSRSEVAGASRARPCTERPAPSSGCHQPRIQKSQRSGWRVPRQSVPGASRSVCRMPSTADSEVAAKWLARPAPVRARSVPLRLPDISSPWRNANRRDGYPPPRLRIPPKK